MELLILILAALIPSLLVSLGYLQQFLNGNSIYCNLNQNQVNYDENLLVLGTINIIYVVMFFIIGTK